MSKSHAIPRFYSLRIYLVASGIFFMLVMPIATIMLFKYGPVWMEDRNAQKNAKSVSESGSETNTADSLIGYETAVSINDQPLLDDKEDYQFSQAFGILARMMLISIALGFAWNYPFRLFFRKKRKGLPLSEKLENFCRKWLLKVPLINAMIVGGGFGIALGFMAFQVYGGVFKSQTSREFFEQFFFISFIGSVLTIIFVYFWFRHRVRFVYLEHVFDSVSLFRTKSEKYSDHIVRRLWINSLMTTLLPLTIVIFYLSFTKTYIDEVGAPHLSDDQIQILFGKYITIIDQASLFQSGHLFYVNAIDSLLMFIGIFSGIFISIVYLFFFVNWTHHSIVVPIKEVVEKMRQPVELELDRLAILRTDDEIGELANGYNEMALRITNNIRTLSQITTANQRFVPDEFLQMLDKESITEISLGDQVQKWMTILFVDIKSFTSLSEQLTPKENFDFLNGYLSMMEPVIRAHHGFIDKFIGDSIMALFPGNPEDAVEAALEMREQLTVFNHELAKNGKPAIDTGAGIHSGNLMLGVVGGAGRMETTVISDAVNLASRLEGLTRTYNSPVIVSESTILSLKNRQRYLSSFIDEVYVKGRSGSVKIYSIEGKSTLHPTHRHSDALLNRIEAAVEYIRSFMNQEAAPLPYHNLRHTLDVFKAATEAAGFYQLPQQQREILQAAALFHEAGIVKGFEKHELKSAEIAAEALPAIGFSVDEINQITGLIMATRMPQNPHDLLSKILCDSDLDYLGREDYEHISGGLREEWIMLNDYPEAENIWLESQISFLSQHSYFTEYAQQRRDAGKQKNIENTRLKLGQSAKL